MLDIDRIVKLHDYRVMSIPLHGILNASINSTVKVLSLFHPLFHEGCGAAAQD